jgi:hypothetical protein
MTYTKQIRLCTLQAVKHQAQHRARGQNSRPWFFNLMSVALVTASAVAIGAIGYYLTFWLLLKCGIEI